MSQKRLKVVRPPLEKENKISMVGLSKKSFKGFRKDLEGQVDPSGTFGDFSSPDLLNPRQQASLSPPKIPKKIIKTELIECKRQILLAKIRIIEKKNKMKEMKENMRYREKELTIRAKDFEEHLKMIRENFVSQKKQLDLLTEDVDYLEEVKISRIKILQEARTKIFEKENEIKNMQERLLGFENYKEFICLFYTHMNRDFNEEGFLQCLLSSRVGLREGFNAEKSWGMAKRKVVESITEPENPFFVTAVKMANRRTLYRPSEIITHLHADFSEMLSIIEKEHLEIFKDIQIEEANIIDITNNINK
jgi:hypothetical protein